MAFLKKLHFTLAIERVQPFWTGGASEVLTERI